MKPAIPLKLCSVAFAVLWTCGMLWSSGIIDRANVIILSICGHVRRARLVPRHALGVSVHQRAAARRSFRQLR